MKELTFEEVLRIAGGVPSLSVLDDLAYRVPAAIPRDALGEARLAEPTLAAPKPE